MLMSFQVDVPGFPQLLFMSRKSIEHQEVRYVYMYVSYGFWKTLSSPQEGIRCSVFSYLWLVVRSTIHI